VHLPQVPFVITENAIVNMVISGGILLPECANDTLLKLLSGPCKPSRLVGDSSPPITDQVLQQRAVEMLA
jgi:hypothetical protein